jgi:hypothetical protein
MTTELTIKILVGFMIILTISACIDNKPGMILYGIGGVLLNIGVLMGMK